MANVKKAKFSQSSKAEKPFWQELEEMLDPDFINDPDGGHMNGSMCGESWKSFLSALREEAVERLKSYRRESYMAVGFRASSLQPYCEERMKIERDYVRNLVHLYGNSARAYKTLSG